MIRLDQRLVELGLAPSRARAQFLIEAGVVEVAGQTATKPSRKVGPEVEVNVTANPNPWVSRAALKLVHALDVFQLTPQGIALDVGASTGGFTQVLLAHGADQVHALDVGHGQLHPDVVADPRVISHEGVNARSIPEGLIPEVDWITSDVSFISLAKALPGPLTRAKPGAQLVALIKPQFEVGPGQTEKGIVRDPVLQEKVRADVATFLKASNWQVTGEAESPITGADGNREFLIAAAKSD
ncbi:MAG: TlyA family RNA methyltransferase [Pseudomonadota bacterium]